MSHHTHTHTHKAKHYNIKAVPCKLAYVAMSSIVKPGLG